MNQQESMPESQPSQQQQQELLPGLGDILDQQLDPEQNVQWQQEQAHDISSADNASRHADQSYSQYNAREQGWWWVWPQKKTINISTWIGLLLLVLALLVSLLLLDSVETTLVRVFFVISLLPFILVFGLIAVSL